VPEPGVAVEADGEGEAPVLRVRGRHHRARRDERRQRQVHAPRGRHGRRGHAAAHVERARPRPQRLRHARRQHPRLLARAAIAQPQRQRAVRGLLHRQRLDVRGDRRPRRPRAERDLQAEARVAGDRVVKAQGPPQALPAEPRHDLHQVIRGQERDLRLRRILCQAAGQLEADEQRPALADGAAIERHHERRRTDQVRREPPQDGPLAQALAYERELPLHQIAETAVNETGRPRRGPGRDVRAIDEQHTQPPQGGVARDAHARRARPDHRDVVPRRGERLHATHSSSLPLATAAREARDFRDDERRGPPYP
jgi:hypothetical protein